MKVPPSPLPPAVWTWAWPSQCLQIKDGQCFSLSVSASLFSWAMVSAFPLKQRSGLESLVPHLPVPGFLWPLPLTWGAAGAAGLMLGVVVLLFLIPAGLVIRVVGGHLQGKNRGGWRIFQG